MSEKTQSEKTHTPRVVREYVRLTFKDGATGKTRTVWATPTAQKGSTKTYRRVTADGDTVLQSKLRPSFYDVALGKHVPETWIETEEMIIVGAAEVTEKRAIMSLHYGELVAEGTDAYATEMEIHGELQAKYAARRAEIIAEKAQTVTG